MIAFIANFKHQHGIWRHVGRRITQQCADEVHAIGAALAVAVQRQRRLGPVLGGQRRHAVGVDVGRVAQDQVVRPLR